MYKTYANLELDEIIAEIRAILNKSEDDNSLTWSELCEATEFDSLTTAMAFGLNWHDSNMTSMPIANLKMALYNITNFPKADTKFLVDTNH